MSLILKLPIRGWLVAAAMALLVGCIGGSGGVTIVDGGGGPAPGFSRVTVQAQFEKRTLTSSGFQSGTTVRPARYQLIEIRQASNDSVLASSFADDQGRVLADVSNGTRIYARAVASFQVPNTSGSSFFQRGSVINLPAPAGNLSGDQQVALYSGSSDWAVSSDALTVNAAGTLTITANTSNRIAGAFNISDQMLALGLKVRDLEPALRLPNLHCYWTTSSNPSEQAWNYPAILRYTNGSVAKLTSTNRAVFTAAVHGLENGSPWTESDEWDDGKLLGTFTNFLFADYSAKEDGSSEWGLLRRDNDYVFASRYRQSESTLAFQTGFTDFLAAAAQNNAQLLDSYRDASGTLRVDAFDLSRHDQIPGSERSEFTRGSVAVTLWGAWKNALGGGGEGLGTLWNAVRTGTALADGTGEFNGATLGCYPSYLLGVKSRAGSSWSIVVAELAKENIPEPTPVYFLSDRLWGTIPSTYSLVFREDATDPGYDFYFEKDQFRSHRFTASQTSNRNITVSNAQNKWVELLGPGGWWTGIYSENAVKMVSLPASAPAGVYAARVRVRKRPISNPPTAVTGVQSYSILVN